MPYDELTKEQHQFLIQNLETKTNQIHAKYAIMTNKKVAKQNKKIKNVKNKWTLLNTYKIEQIYGERVFKFSASEVGNQQFDHRFPFAPESSDEEEEMAWD